MSVFFYRPRPKPSSALLALSVILVPSSWPALLSSALPVHELRAQEAPESLSRIDSLFSDFEGTHNPGCALGVVRDGKLVVERGYGMANLDHGIPITGESVFYLASVSKQLTAAAVVLASQEGHLSLDDDIREHLPELPSYGSTITVRHLLHHTSGLRDYLTLMGLARMPLENAYSDQEILDLIARQEELNFLPGEEYLYSNTNYLLLAELVKRATGSSLQDFAHSRIFQPLGMDHTHFHDDASAIVPNRVFSYVGSREHGFRTEYLMNFDKVGDGGLYSSVRDLSRWILNFDHPKVGGAEFLETIHTQGVLNDGDTIPYALGLQIGDHRGLATVRHGGSLMAFRTAVLRFPQERLSVITLCNAGNANPVRLSMGVAEIYLEDRLETPEASETEARPQPPAERAEEPAPSPTPQELLSYAGIYRSRELGVSYTLAEKSGRLVLRRRASPDLFLAPAAPGVFRVRQLTLRFQTGPEGNVLGFLLDAGRVQNLRFERSEARTPLSP